MIISRYIFTEFIKKVLTILFIMLLLYLVIDLFEKVDEFIVQKATFMQLLQYFSFKVPLIITQVMPIAVLMATIFLIGIFSKNSELIAMKACGLPMIRIVYPILLTSVVLSFLMFVLNELVVPKATAKSNYIFQVEIRKWKETTFFDNSNIWIKSHNNFFWNVGYFNKETNILNNIRVFKLDENHKVEYRVDAKSAQWNGESWILSGGELWDFKNPLKFYSEVIDNQEFKVLKTPPSAFKIVQRPSEELNFYELN
ncbi:MAG: LptF/LptG family permease, partial [Nitrospinae bacterium]|nr:LptF/LptG family permease [Nitrospinota bacterium]